MEFLRSFLRRHLAGKQFVASQNVSCFLRLRSYWTIKSMMAGMFFQIVFFILTPIAERARQNTVRLVKIQSYILQTFTLLMRTTRPFLNKFFITYTILRAKK